jgi:hypothetical protein
MLMIVLVHEYLILLKLLLCVQSGMAYAEYGTPTRKRSVQKQ